MNPGKRGHLTGLTPEGESAKGFDVYRCDANGRPHEKISHYDTLDEALGHRWRFDRHEVIFAGGKYCTERQFKEWAKQQKAKQSGTSEPPMCKE